jgi:hypothetical protein
MSLDIKAELLSVKRFSPATVACDRRQETKEENEAFAGRTVLLKEVGINRR